MFSGISLGGIFQILCTPCYITHVWASCATEAAYKHTSFIRVASCASPTGSPVQSLILMSLIAQHMCSAERGFRVAVSHHGLAPPTSDTCVYVKQAHGHVVPLVMPSYHVFSVVARGSAGPFKSQGYLAKQKGTLTLFRRLCVCMCPWVRGQRKRQTRARMCEHGAWLLHTRASA